MKVPFDSGLHVVTFFYSCLLNIKLYVNHSIPYITCFCISTAATESAIFYSSLKAGGRYCHALRGHYSRAYLIAQDKRYNLYLVVITIHLTPPDPGGVKDDSRC